MLLDRNCLRSFSYLQTLYTVPHTDFLKFAQIKHVIVIFHPNSELFPLKSSLFFSTQQPVRSKVRGYSMTYSQVMISKSPSMIKWEADLGKQFSVLQWSKAIHCAHHSSACAKHKLQYQKLLTRWYFTPLHIAKAYTMAFQYCWRSCGSVGSLLHVFWSCSLLCPFWDNILSLIFSITQQKCPTTLEFALLLIEIESIPPKFRIVVCNVLHAARLTIARHWRSNMIPTLLEVNAIVSDISPVWHNHFLEGGYSGLP